MIIKILKPLSFIPALLLMYIIFSFSAQDGETSAELSYQVSYKIVEVGGEVLGADLQNWEIESLANRFHTPVRKLAHMTEYFALALAVAFPLYVYGLRGILLLFTAGMICVGFACGDEYHQAYVAGRGPSKRDVLIDSIGVFFGIILVRIVGWTGRRTVFRPFSSKKKKEAQSDPRMQDVPGYGYEQQPYGGQSYPYPPHNYYNQPDPAFRPDDAYAGQLYGGRPFSQGGADRPARGSSPAMNHSGQSYPPRGYYGASSYPAYPQGDPGFLDEEEVGTSDRLSEDMSFRKLMSDLRDQKQVKQSSRKAEAGTHETGSGRAHTAP